MQINVQFYEKYKDVGNVYLTTEIEPSIQHIFDIACSDSKIKCLASCAICIGKYPRARLQRLVDLGRNRKMSVFSCISLFACWAAISLVVHLGRQKMFFELTHWLLLSLQVIRHRKMSLIPPLHVFIGLIIELSVLKISKSI